MGRLAQEVATSRVLLFTTSNTGVHVLLACFSHSKQQPTLLINVVYAHGGLALKNTPFTQDLELYDQVLFKRSGDEIIMLAIT